MEEKVKESEDFTVHHHCTITAPSLHHHCRHDNHFVRHLDIHLSGVLICFALNHHCTITAPSQHHHCTITADELDKVSSMPTKQKSHLGDAVAAHFRDLYQ